MGANRTEYENSFRNNSADDLRSNVDESRAGNAYQKHLGKMMLPGAIAPMAGMIGSTSFQSSADTAAKAGDMIGSQNYSDYADYALGAGSALGAIAAPLMFRGGARQTSNNAADMNNRSKSAASGERQGIMKNTDNVLNAGTAVQKAGMGAVGTAYGANAIDIASGGSGLVSSQQLMGMSKLSSIATPGGAAVTSGLGMDNAMAPFMKDASGKFGTTDYSEIGMGGGDMAGMAVMMAAMMGGQKLTKSIKGMANKTGKDKYKYKSSSLGAQPDRDLAKYNVLGSAFTAQVGLLAMTDKLSPFENLALTALSAIASNTGSGPALYNFFTGKEDSGNRNLKAAHNKLANALGQEDEFSSLSGHMSAKKKSSFAQLVDQYSHVMDSIDKTILGVTKGVTAGATALNPLNILFGGLFGPSAEKQISGMYGLDEESMRENAIDRTAKNLNLPVGMVAIAETRADKILKMAGDDPDSKKIAALQLIAEINRNQLILMLDEKAAAEGNGGFIGKTQEQYEIMDTSSGVDGALKKFRGLAGNIPGIGLIASIFAMQEARNKNKEQAAMTLADDLDYQLGRQDDSMSHEALAASFLGTQFPILFLETLELDTERNVLLTEIRDMVEQQSIGSDSEAMKARRGMYPRAKGNKAWDLVTGTIMSSQDEEKSREADNVKKKKDIEAFYAEAMKKHPNEKKEIKKQKAAELKALQKESTKGELSLQQGKDAEKEEKRKNKTVDFLESITASLEKMTQPDKSGMGGSQSGSKMEGLFAEFKMKGSLGGKLWVGSKIILTALGSLLQWAWQNSMKAVLPAIAVGYLGYLSYTNIGWVKNVVDGAGRMLGTVAKALVQMDNKMAVASTGLAAYGIFKIVKSPTTRAVGMALWSLFKYAKSNKLKAALGLGIIGVLGGTLLQSFADKGNTIFNRIANSMGLGDDKGEKITTQDTVAFALGTIGWSLIRYAPHPFMKLGGAVMVLGGLAAGADWGALLNKGKGLLYDLLGDWIVPKSWAQYSSTGSADSYGSTETNQATLKEIKARKDKKNKKDAVEFKERKKRGDMTLQDHMVNATDNQKARILSIIAKADKNNDGKATVEELKDAGAQQQIQDFYVEVMKANKIAVANSEMSQEENREQKKAIAAALISIRDMAHWQGQKVVHITAVKDGKPEYPNKNK